MYWVLDRKSSYTDIEMDAKKNLAFQRLKGSHVDGFQSGVSYDMNSLNKLWKVMENANQKNCDYDN